MVWSDCAKAARINESAAGSSMRTARNRSSIRLQLVLCPSATTTFNCVTPSNACTTSCFGFEVSHKTVDTFRFSRSLQISTLVTCAMTLYRDLR